MPWKQDALRDALDSGRIMNRTFCCYNAHFSYVQQFICDHNVSPFKKVFVGNFVENSEPTYARIDPFTGELIGGRSKTTQKREIHCFTGDILNTEFYPHFAGRVDGWHEKDGFCNDSSMSQERSQESETSISSIIDAFSTSLSQHSSRRKVMKKFWHFFQQ